MSARVPARPRLSMLVHGRTDLAGVSIHTQLQIILICIMILNYTAGSHRIRPLAPDLTQ